jgi:hypothetical protein
VRVQSSLVVDRFQIDQRQFLMVHPIGEVRFKIPPRSTTLQAAFAIKPDAYEHTEGVEFRASIVSSAGVETRLWQRMLTPRDIPADRGVQRFELPLPADADGEIVLHTLPGPNGKIDWGWAGWADVRFTQ